MGHRKKKRRLNPEDDNRSSDSDIEIVFEYFHKKHLSDLPYVAFDNIIMRLGLESKKALRLTCTAMANLTMEYMKFCPVLSNDTFQTLRNSKYFFSTLTVTDLDTEQIKLRPNSKYTSHVTTLKIFDNKRTGRFLTSTDFSWFMNAFNNLTYFSLSGIVLSCIASTKFHTFRFPHLVHFKVTFTKPRGRTSLQIFSSLYYPKLKNFELTVAKFQKKLSWAEYNWITIFIGYHSQTLNRLSITDKGLPTIVGNEPGPAAQPDDDKLAPLARGSMLERIPIVRLESLELRNNSIPDNYFQPMRWVHSEQLIQGQNRLKKLMIEILSSDELPNLKLVLQKCSMSLEYVRIVCAPTVVIFDCDCLSSCPNLKTLYLVTNREMINLDALPPSITQLIFNGPVDMNLANAFQTCLTNLKSLYIWAVTVELGENVALRLMTLPGLERFVCKTFSLESLLMVVRLNKAVGIGEPSFRACKDCKYYFFDSRI